MTRTPTSLRGRLAVAAIVGLCGCGDGSTGNPLTTSTTTTTTEATTTTTSTTTTTTTSTTTTTVPAPRCSWDTVAFHEDWDTAENGSVDPDVWIVNHPGKTWWVQGRTHFPDPLSTTGPFPRVEAGACILEHHLYNQWDNGSPKTTFLGGEIHTVLEFAPTRSYRFEARVRSHPYPGGLVSSFFTYGYDETNNTNDEIDFEFVSKKTNDELSYPSGDPVLTNLWDEASENPRYVAPSGLDLSEWNTFRIYWYPGRRVEWTWVDPINGETCLRSQTDGVPDEPMNLYFNFWAPSAIWADAYDASLQPVDNESDDEIHTYEIDYVEVRSESLETVCESVCGDGAGGDAVR